MRSQRHFKGSQGVLEGLEILQMLSGGSGEVQERLRGVARSLKWFQEVFRMLHMVSLDLGTP